MLPTPSTSHVNFNHIYEPAEDSYLLLDTLSSASETAFLTSRFGHADPTISSASTVADALVAAHTYTQTPPPLILEVGTGSGVVLAFLAANAPRILNRSDILALGTDINSFACRAAARTVHGELAERKAHDEGAVSLDVLIADLASCVRAREVDVLVFNPPYVPAPLPDFAKHDAHNSLALANSKTSFEQDSHLLSLSYAGGEDGMEVTNRLLADIPRILSPRGVAYLLLCRQNRPEAVMKRIKGWNEDKEVEWKVDIVGRSGRKAGWEMLCILRIWRQGGNSETDERHK